MDNADLIYERKVREANLYGQAYFGHKATSAQTRKLNRLWNESLDITYGIAFISKGGVIRVSMTIDSPAPDEKRLPSVLYVRWRDDQSENEIFIKSQRGINYEFSPARDPAMALEYADQLVALLF